MAGPSSSVKAIVIGAGFAGLAAADELVRAGADVRVVEARGRVGGRVWSVPFAGGIVERGAEFVLPGNTAVAELAARFDLALVRKGTKYGEREPAGGAAVDVAAVRQAVADLEGATARRGETLDALMARARIPPAVAEAIRARIEVSCAHPASDLAAGVVQEGGAAFGDFDTHTAQGGNARLATALAGAIGEERIRLSAPATHLRSAAGVEVVAGGERLRADAAVVAVPAAVIGAITFEPPLPADAAAAFGAVRYGQAAKLFVALRTPAPPSATLSVPARFWCWTQLTAGERPAHYVGAFAGTSDALCRLEVAAGPERWLEALADLRPDLHLDPDRVMLCSWADDPWVRGAYSAPSAGAPLHDVPVCLPARRIAFAGEHTAGPWHATMEGALRSGVRAARELLGDAVEVH